MKIRFKSHFPIAAILLLFTACKITRPAGSYTNLPPTGEPFVELKTGETVTGDVRLKQPFIGRSRVEVDGKAYKPADVAFFQDDRARYANVGRNTFAPQVVDGNIKLFRNIVTYTTMNYGSGVGGMGVGSGFGRTSTHSRTIDYMLPAGKKQVTLFNYENLKKAIPAGDPSLVHLDAYLKQQRTGRIIAYSGLGAMIGGAIIAGAALSRESSGGVTAGGTLFLLGIPAVYTGMIKSAFKRKHLYRALDAYNGEQEESAAGRPGRYRRSR